MISGESKSPTFYGSSYIWMIFVQNQAVSVHLFDPQQSYYMIRLRQEIIIRINWELNTYVYTYGNDMFYLGSQFPPQR